MNIDLAKLIEILRRADPSIKRIPAPAATEWTDDDMITIFRTAAEARSINYDVDQNNRSCIVNMAKWLFGVDSFKCLNPEMTSVISGRLDKGLYIYGPTGTGKTLAVRLLKDLSRGFGLKYNQLSSQRSFDWNAYRTDDIVERFMHGDSLKQMKDEPIVCFEDLGSEITEATYMGTKVNVMRTILEQRGEDHNVLSIFTSNLPLSSKELADKYGDRVISRLCDMTNLLVMKGPDRRRKL